MNVIRLGSGRSSRRWSSYKRLAPVVARAVVRPVSRAFARARSAAVRSMREGWRIRLLSSVRVLLRQVVRRVFYLTLRVEPDAPVGGPARPEARGGRRVG